MSTPPTPPSRGVGLSLPDGSTVLTVMKSTTDGGCGRAWTPTLGTTFVRWQLHSREAGLHSDAASCNRCAPANEYQALSTVASTLTPTPLSLSHHAEMTVSHASWIESVGSVRSCPRIDESLVDRLLDILQRAHRAGWVHGDIKPEN